MSKRNKGAASAAAVDTTVETVDTVAPSTEATEATEGEGQTEHDKARAQDKADAAAAAEAKAKPVKILPLAADAKYIVSVKGREYAGKADKLSRGRPDPDKAGTGKDWYDLAEKRLTRRQIVMRCLLEAQTQPVVDEAGEPVVNEAGEPTFQTVPWSAEDGRKVIADAIATGRLQKGSENSTVLLGLCHACKYIEQE